MMTLAEKKRAKHSRYYSRHRERLLQKARQYRLSNRKKFLEKERLRREAGLQLRPVMKEIALTQGKFALVDDEDFEALSRFKWQAEFCRGRWYVRRKEELPKVGGKRRRRSIMMHQQLVPGAPQVDHKDGDGFNNQRHNLRPATHSQNQANVGKIRRECSSKFRGVVWDKSRGKWKVQPRVDGVDIYVGRFDTEREGAEAYDRFALERFGEYARLNFPRKEG